MDYKGWLLRVVRSDIAVRAAKTFVQALMSAITVEVLISGDQAAIESALIAAGAAALSVVWNWLLAWSRS